MRVADLTPQPPLLKERGRKSFPSPLGEGWLKAGVRLLLFALATLPLAAAPIKGKTVTLTGGDDAQMVGGPAKKLIFLDFYNESNDKNLQYLSNSIGDAVDAAIKDKYRYTVIPSATWKKYANENKWQEKDFYDNNKIREMGKALGADGVIYGKYTSKEGNLEIQGVIFSVIDGEIVDKQEGATPISAEMFETINQVSDNLAKKIKDLFVPSDRGALVRSLIFPGWGHFYKQRRNWGYFWGGTAIAATAFTATMLTLFIVHKAKYANYAPRVYTNGAGGTGHYDEAASQAEFDRIENLGNTYGQMTLIGMGVAGAVYIAAFVHAYLIAPDLGNITQPGAVSALPVQFSIGPDAWPLGGTRTSLSYGYRF